MKRTSLILGAAAIAVASTAVIATAHDRGAGFRGGDRPGPAMLIEEFDLDGDGKVTRDEIGRAAEARFAEADADGDGKLSVEELVDAAAERRAERRIARHDTDGDGMLSLAEATAMAEHPRLDRMFDLLDADDDGAVTAAELEEMRGMMRDGHGGRGWFGGRHGHGRN